ncbi:(2Fe-2S)-binding protein [Pseudomonas syringae]|uniref:(2Fe-2S)-binding protein n=1 Tax=Pseudomonas sp. MWU16-30316 TaxID=2878093 RepID=UPI0011010413|nr:(2Fe-2S)-binding protein [Pseudomonas sp. MWU16-30316]TFZ36164.1 (2Fe-2S)-binding protein [Pseudomonas syringae]
MSTKPLFRSVDDQGSGVVIEFDGQKIQVPNNANLAAALLDAGISTTRKTPVSGAPRGAYCMMGVCFECLVEINGISRQACQVRTEPGMRIKTHFPVKIEGSGNV